jgi:uncharacterized protein YkwD
MKRLLRSLTVMAIVVMLTNSYALGAAGDVNNDGDTDLKDAVMSLQVNAGLSPTGVTSNGDVNNDDKTGLEETVYVLQVAAKLRIGTGSGACLSAEEISLANLINNYRDTNGLSSVPISKSLTTVAQWHVWDLQTNNPVTTTCNLHSWSGQKPDLWTEMCYTADHAQAQKMWDKPKEITHNVYSGYGYEISASASQITAAKAFAMWQSSSAHNEVILEQGIWAGQNWSAMGIGISGNYAMVWFGNMADPLGTITQCQ